MRLDTPVYFQRIETKYNPATGNYDAEKITETKRYASVTNSGANTVQLVYGELKQGVLTVRLQTPFNDPFDRIRIADKAYRVDNVRNLRTKQVFIVSEVQ